MATSSEQDVIIIGGGITGLIAARNLAECGVRVLLLEASERIGGRIFDLCHRHTFIRPNKDSADNNNNATTLIALGADRFSAEKHERVLAEIRRYGLHYTKHSDNPRTSYMRKSTFDVEKIDDYLRKIRDSDAYRNTIRLLNEDSQGFDLGTGFDQSEMSDLDCSFAQYMSERLQLSNDDEMAEYLRVQLFTLFGAEIEEISAMMVIQQVASFGCAEKMLIFPERFDYIVGGFGELVSRIERDFLSHPGCAIRKGTAVIGVSSVVQEQQNQTIKYDYRPPNSIARATRVKLSNGEELESLGVIVTVPLNVILSIKFDPPLPPTSCRGAERSNSNRNYLRLFCYAEGVTVRISRLISRPTICGAFESKTLAHKLVTIPSNTTAEEEEVRIVHESEYPDVALIPVNTGTSNVTDQSAKRKFSVVMVAARRNDILETNRTSILSTLKNLHPDIRLSPESQFLTGHDVCQTDRKDLTESAICFHDFTRDPFIRSAWFNLRPGSSHLHHHTSQSLRNPWGPDNLSLYITSADLFERWTGWVEGGIEAAHAATQVMIPNLFPQRIPRNFAKRVSP